MEILFELLRKYEQLRITRAGRTEGLHQVILLPGWFTPSNFYTKP